MSGPPPPSGPPRGGPPPPVEPSLGSPAPVGQPTGASGKRRWRSWLIIGLVALLLLGGCGVLVTIGGLRAFRSVTAPIDVANAYLDAARAGADLTATACRPEQPPWEPVTSSRSQSLTNVEISGGLAQVSGSITLGDGVTTPVRIDLSRRDDGWCVREVVL